MLREELQLLQEQGSHVAEVVKPMDKKKVLVKVTIPSFSLIGLLFGINLCRSNRKENLLLILIRILI